MSAAHRPRVLLADDHLLVAEALKSLLTPEFDLVGVVEDGRELIEAAQTLQPDVIVADITMPHLNGIDALVRLRQGGDRTPVVFLTMHRDATFARRALDAGASGFVLKHSASVELIAAIRAALQGKTYLTPQLAAEVLESMKAGPGASRRGTDRFPHAEAAGGPPTPGRGPLGERDRLEPRNLGADGGVPQIPDDGGPGSAHQRRADPLRHQARSRRAVARYDGASVTCMRTTA